MKLALQRETPIFGICLGRLLALARLLDLQDEVRQPRRQPKVSTRTNRCYITAQNHGFAVDADSLPAG